MNLECTAYRKVANDEGTVYLFDLYKFDGDGFFQEPSLVFEVDNKEVCWDNNKWLLKFFKALKKNKKWARKELKEHCQEEDLTYESTMEDLLDIFSTAKKLKFFKK